MARIWTAFSFLQSYKWDPLIHFPFASFECNQFPFNSTSSQFPLIAWNRTPSMRSNTEIMKLYLKFNLRYNCHANAKLKFTLKCDIRDDSKCGSVYKVEENLWLHFGEKSQRQTSIGFSPIAVTQELQFSETLPFICGEIQRKLKQWHLLSKKHLSAFSDKSLSTLLL